MILRVSLTIAVAAAGLVRAEDAPPPGAKEFFFEPQRTVAEVTSASRPAKITDDQGRRIAQASPDLPQLGLSYWIELIATGGGRGEHVTEERTFHSGERIRLHFRGNTSGRIKIVQLGTSGGSSILFPDPDKGLADNRILTNRDHVLPSGKHWFRFDDESGTERLLVLFARDQEDLDRAFPTKRVMNAAATAALLHAVERSHGSKDLLIERETREPGEIGDYVVNVAGHPIALAVELTHR